MWQELLGFTFFFRQTPLRMYFTLDHKGIVGTGRQLPLSSRKDRRLESCLSSVLTCCLSSQLPPALSQEEGKRVTSFADVSLFCVPALVTSRSILSPAVWTPSSSGSLFPHLQPFPTCTSRERGSSGTSARGMAEFALP